MHVTVTEVVIVAFINGVMNCLLFLGPEVIIMWLSILWILSVIMHAHHWLWVHTAIYVMFRIVMLSLQVCLLRIAVIPMTLVRWLTKLKQKQWNDCSGHSCKGTYFMKKRTFMLHLNIQCIHKLTVINWWLPWWENCLWCAIDAGWLISELDGAMDTCPDGATF